MTMIRDGGSRSINPSLIDKIIEIARLNVVTGV